MQARQVVSRRGTAGRDEGWIGTVSSVFVVRDGLDGDVGWYPGAAFEFG